MRSWMTACVLALAVAACGGAPELRAPERTLEADAFLAMPAAEAPVAMGDSALPPPAAPPVAEVTPVEPAADEQQCDPNYRPCVPVDSDVDCKPGRGNGPSYVHGPVEVIGTDVYGLDRDGDGIGCDR